MGGGSGIRLSWLSSIRKRPELIANRTPASFGALAPRFSFFFLPVND